MSIARDLSQLRVPVQVDTGGTGNNGTITALASDVNWDTIISPGSYFIPTATGSSRPVTTATTVNYIAEVINTPNGLKQTATLYGTPQTFSRSVSSGSWQSWYKTYDNNSVVGPVSQVGGVPTGAIIQSGSGSGARWVRYADGTQIIWGVYAAGVLGYAGAVGSLWASNSPSIPYPVAFVGDGPVFTIQVIAAGADVWASGGQAGQPLTMLPSVLLFAPTSGNRNTIITYTAHGRWY